MSYILSTWRVARLLEFDVSRHGGDDAREGPHLRALTRRRAAAVKPGGDQGGA
jgi:hypothetical protein